MNSSEYAVLMIPSVSHALLSEKAVKSAGIPCKLIPTPREISSDCGIVLRIPLIESERVLLIVTSQGIENDGLIQLTR